MTKPTASTLLKICGVGETSREGIKKSFAIGLKGYQRLPGLSELLNKSNSSKASPEMDIKSEM